MPFDCVLAAWRDHEKELRNFLRQRLGDADQADDLLQELFVKSLRQGQNFCSLDNPRAWLFQVARNAMVDHARLGKSQVELPEHLAADEITREGVDELDACLQRNLARMAEEDRDIIVHCDLQGMKQQAYAEQYQLSLPAVKSRLLRARQRLRDAELALLEYPWPGNVRELKHAIERAYILFAEEQLTPEALFEESLLAECAAVPDTDLSQYLLACERRYVLNALKSHQWHMANTAAALGISTKNLWEKRRKLGISAPDKET